MGDCDLLLSCQFVSRRFNLGWSITHEGLLGMKFRDISHCWCLGMRMQKKHGAIFKKSLRIDAMHIAGFQMFWYSIWIGEKSPKKRLTSERYRKWASSPEDKSRKSWMEWIFHFFSTAPSSADFHRNHNFGGAQSILNSPGAPITCQTAAAAAHASWKRSIKPRRAKAKSNWQKVSKTIIQAFL